MRLIAIAAVHICYIHAIPPFDLNLHIIPALTIEQIQVGYALLLATISNLKSFIMSFNTAMMMDFGDYKAHASGKSRSVSVDPCDHGKAAASTTRAHRYSDMSTQGKLIGRLRPERLEHRATSHHVDDIRAWDKDLPGAEVRESQDKAIQLDMGKVEEESEGK
jgi:hypothetical protein